MNSVGSQFACGAIKAVWLRDTAPLSFTHRALLRLVTQCTHFKNRKKMGGGGGGGACIWNTVRH